jgi:hypothetical protein
MKIQLDIQNIKETVEGDSPDELLKKIKDEASKRAPLLLRGAIKAMSPLKFAGEAVKHHNRTKNTDDPAPESAQQFLDWSVACGYVKIIEN